MRARTRVVRAILALGVAGFPVASHAQGAATAIGSQASSLTRTSLSGVILDSTGAALRDVRVTVSGVVGEWRSKGDGSFVVNGISPGTHVVEAIALGFAPERRIVDFASGDTAQVALSMAPLTTRLSPVVIEERAHYNARKDEIDQRSRAGFGFRTDSVELARLPGVWDAFNFPGVHVGGPPCCWGISMTGTYSLTSKGGIGMGITCSPTIWIDAEISDIDMLHEIHKEEIAIIEIYNSAARAPLQFTGTRTNCGVVLVWRKQYVNPPGVQR